MMVVMIASDWQDHHGIRLPRTLVPGGDAERATILLRAYFAPLSGKNTGYTGGQWDRFDPSGTRETSANVFTPDDLLSASLLSTPIPGRAAMDLLTDADGAFAAGLAAIGADRDFADLENLDEAPFAAARSLYRLVKELPGVGETRATKLLARKRPHLIPIVDRVLKQTIFFGQRHQWAPLHAALVAEDRALHRTLLDLHRAAGLSEQVAPVRVLDVLAWLEGSGNAQRVLARQEIHEEPVEGE